jgi:isopentenyldiphosphate isomerase
MIGHETEAVCHDDEGLLHRAFAVFLFKLGSTTITFAAPTTTKTAGLSL